MGTQRALGRRVRSPDALDTILIGLVDRIALRLRAAHRVCRTVVLRMRFADFTRATRSHTLHHPTAQTRVILATARALLADSIPVIERKGLTLLGISLTSLANDRPLQLPLPLEQDQTALDTTLDDLKNRFGAAIVTRAVLLGKSPGITMPQLPD